MTLNVTPGVNVLVEIAIDQLNRILTPFPNPQVRTVAEASTSVDGSAVYLATSSEVPITLFISDASDPNHALSLTLAPRRIPPRELRLVLTDPLPLPSQTASATVPPGASAPEYVERLTEAMRALAREELPEGYRLRPARPDESVDCVQDGLETRRGQVLEGQDVALVTALVRNVSAARLEIEERACRAQGEDETVAVAAWPQVWLEPGEMVELYLAVRPTPPERVHPPRPSLLGAERR
ncbi:TraK domain-containing protein [Thiorhodococcus minor]|uniref:TraK domain-containing protein n=1 Tax=Thiorhodococcus minor TaxID=57489 RepID=UPI003158A1F3